MKFRWVIISSVIVAAILLGLPLESWVPPFLVKIGRGLGEALIIAVFLALTVDAFVKSKLAKEFAKDISPFMASASLPREIQNEIRAASIIDLYRRPLILDYEIKTLESDPNFSILIARANYTLHNVTDKPIKHEHLVLVEKPFRPSSSIKQILHVCARNVLTPQNAVGDYDELAADEDLGEDSEDGTHRMWRRELLIPPGGSDFVVKTYQILPAEHSETFVSVIASVDVTVNVRCPNDFVATVTFGHRARGELIPTPKDRPEYWQFKGGVLPYHPIIVQWRKAATPGTPEEPGEALREHAVPADVTRS